MTTRVYYTEPELYECEAVVTSSTKTEDGYELTLDRTVIFPEGGGQPSDDGMIDSALIRAAREAQGEIYHISNADIAPGTRVVVRVNDKRRIDHSQQHTGEHIISGLASKLFGAHNVGFHMAEDYSTLDLDAALSEEQLKQLELAANEAVQRAIPVTYEFVGEQELSSLTLRKQAQGLRGDIRIVYIDGVDSCTCCGTHCKTTGNVGAVKLTSWSKYKGGTRIWFACGMRAIAHSIAEQRALSALAKRFSVKPEDVLDAALRQGDELSSCKRELKRRTGELLEYRADSLLGGAESIDGVKLIVYHEAGLGAQELRQLSEKLTATGAVTALLFSSAGDTLAYIAASSAGARISMRTVIDAVNAATGGKGGGRDAFAQGSAKLGSGIDSMLEGLRAYMRAVIKGG